MGIVLTILSPYFLTVQNIRSLLITASTLSLIGAALTIVLIAGEIDLSFAAMQAFAGSISALLIIEAGVPWPLGHRAGGRHRHWGRSRERCGHRYRATPDLHHDPRDARDCPGDSLPLNGRTAGLELP